MEKNVMVRTGETVVTDEAIEGALFVAQKSHRRALSKKRAGEMDDYWQEISYYIGIKNALETLGLVIRKDYDFNDLEPEEEEE